MGEDFVYGIKNVTNEIEEKYEKLKTELNKPLWDINKKVVLSGFIGVEKRDIKELNKNLTNKDSPKIPKDYIKLLQVFNSLNVLNSFVIYGHQSYNRPSIYFNSFKKYPLYIDANCLNIGSYNPDNSPIFINQKGNILVFSGTYIFDEKHEGLKQETQDALIAYWDNIEDFIADETERYYKIFIEQPFAFPTKEMLPHNITKEKFKQLVIDKKIDVENTNQSLIK